jgi:phospholipid/cholesterol/gamma-HCH transport system substrate-binding protein
VALEGGQATSAPLLPEPPADVAVITTRPSVLQGLMTDAPDLLSEAILLMRDIRSFTTPENGAAITRILQNVETATARIDDMATRTTVVMDAAEATLARADAALIAAEGVLTGVGGVIADDLPGILRRFEDAVETFGQAASGFDAFTRNLLPQFGALASDARALVANINAVTSRIGSDPGRFLLGTQAPDYRR